MTTTTKTRKCLMVDFALLQPQVTQQQQKNFCSSINLG